MRDMAPRQDRSIRNIPVSSVHRRAPTRYAAEEYEEDQRPPRRIKRRRGSKAFLFWAIGVALVFGIAGVLLSTLFAGASVVVHQRTAEVPASTTVAAEPNPPAGTLPYATVTLTTSGTTTVNASGSQKVSRQASGVITIFNTAGAENQRLIANTRFEAPDGKIYRIRDSVVVPGMQGTTAGKVTATVYADVAGAEYNRGQTRFTIPGFKGDPKYDKFYAETTSISGGFVGNEPAVAPADLATAKTDMEQKLKVAVEQAIASQIPEGYTLVKGGLQYTFSDVRQIPEGTNRATISEDVTATAAVVRTSDLAAAVALQSVEGYTGEAVMFAEPENISVSTTDKPVGRINLTISGTDSVVWQYDSVAFKAALLGKNKNTFESIVTSFKPALTGAEATIRPFWQTNFPSDPEKITVKEEL